MTRSFVCEMHLARKDEAVQPALRRARDMECEDHGILVTRFRLISWNTQYLQGWSNFFLFFLNMPGWNGDASSMPSNMLYLYYNYIFSWYTYDIPICFPGSWSVEFRRIPSNSLHFPLKGGRFLLRVPWPTGDLGERGDEVPKWVRRIRRRTVLPQQLPRVHTHGAPSGGRRLFHEYFGPKYPLHIVTGYGLPLA